MCQAIMLCKRYRAWSAGFVIFFIIFLAHHCLYDSLPTPDGSLYQTSPYFARNITKYRSFIFNAGFNSQGGNIVNSSVNHCSIESLKDRCLSTPGCVGFYSDGTCSLKNEILSVEKWTYDQDTTSEGLYTLDIDYCQIMKCSSNEEVCINGKGNYSCIHKQDTTVQLAVCLDEKGVAGFVPLLHSIISHTKAKIEIHVIVTNSESERSLQKLIDCIYTPDNIQIEIVQYAFPSSIENFISVHGKEKKYLNSLGNFARLFLDRILPSLSYVLYIDVDTVVVHDLGQLWNTVFATNELIAAVPSGKFKKKKLFYTVKSIYRKRYGVNLNPSNTYSFNAGVYGLNLSKWRQYNLTEEVLFWMKQNKKYSLWPLGTQPILNILGCSDLKVLDPRWNNCVTDCVSSDNASIYHWNGHCKPWMDCDENLQWRDIWQQYNKGTCNGLGDCTIGAGSNVNHRRTMGLCSCYGGNHGQYCELGKTISADHAP